MMKHTFIILSVITLTSCKPTIKENENFLENLMRLHPEKFDSILLNRDKLEVQIIYTQIERDANNVPTFKSFYFNVDSTRYFYPASTVKLPIALMALEKLNHLQIPGLDKFTPMLNDSLYAGQFSAHKDSTSQSGFPSVEHYVKKILVVSDNDAYNRLYEFLGQKAINEILQQKGYYMKIFHRLERPLSPDQNRHTEAVRFVQNDLIIYPQPMLVNTDSILPYSISLKGKAHFKNDVLINKPFDFTYKNFYPLTTQQNVLRALLFPETVAPNKRFNITEEDRQFVLKYMSQLPTETSYPAYKSDAAYYYDAFCKFFMFGDSREKIPSSIRIFNKVGDAYGYVLDNAYIIDTEHNIEFMLTAVINTNTDEIYNDDVSEYHTIGYPFMQNLGKAIYNYEVKRPRKNTPDLSAFNLTYDKP
ncbi:MAG: serine hydrolase [Chryseolinea sp.]